MIIGNLHDNYEVIFSKHEVIAMANLLEGACSSRPNVCYKVELKLFKEIFRTLANRAITEWEEE